MVDIPSGEWQKMNDSVIRLEEAVKSFKYVSGELKASVDKLVGKYENLPCIEHREKIKSNRVWLRALWLILTGTAAVVAGALIKIAIELGRAHP